MYVTEKGFFKGLYMCSENLFFFGAITFGLLDKQVEYSDGDGIE